MIIEFFGLPGSGKSSIARKVSENSEFKLIKIRSRTELIKFNILFFIKNPYKFIWLFLLIVKNSSGLFDFYYKFMNSFLDYNAKLEKASREEYAIIDQGYFQNVLAVYKREIDKSVLRQYLKEIKKPDFLIIVDLDKKKRQERIIERGHGVKNVYSDKESDRWTERAEKSYQFFKENIKDLYSNYLIIDSSDSIEDTSKKIIDLI
ncbi:hypothetical protein C0583_03735 [Candidatus Parcubacteria bacterium]|nr:MAG: hypothetical protein C0583_03735 [Candidatus Parcubacteria bacterium]